MPRMLVLDVTKNDVYEKECNCLQDYYNIIKCKYIDIAVRKIGDRYFDIIVDDEGLFKEDVVISAIDSDKQPMLVGTLIFCNHDSLGNETSLSDMDIEHINSYIRPVTNIATGITRLMLTECNFM